MRGKKTARDVMVAAASRMDILYRKFDRVVVAFSGGKDSTACLHLAIEAAERHGRLPVEAIFYDEESIYPTTVEYVERIRHDPKVKLYWYCVPVEHRNACSRDHPTYHVWDPALRHLWCRDPPECALFDLPLRNDLKWKWHAESMPFAILPRSPKETIAMVLGIRAQESPRRRMAVLHREHENWLMQTPYKGSQVTPAYPIYDWMLQDVWFYPQLHGFDYNRTYDLFDLAGVPIHQQRVCPPFGEEPLAALHLYASLAPDMWAKMVMRVPGAATAARYGRTELFSFNNLSAPPGLTFREWTFQLLKLYPPQYRQQVSDGIARVMALHSKKTQSPIPDSDPDPVTGLSWKYLAMMANRGDAKGRRAQYLGIKALGAAQARGEDNDALLANAAANLGTRY